MLSPPRLAERIQTIRLHHGCATDSVKITYPPMLQHFALAAIKRRHYHVVFSSLETAAPPAAEKLPNIPRTRLIGNLV